MQPKYNATHRKDCIDNYMYDCFRFSFDIHFGFFLLLLFLLQFSSFFLFCTLMFWFFCVFFTSFLLSFFVQSWTRIRELRFPMHAVSTNDYCCCYIPFASFCVEICNRSCAPLNAPQLAYLLVEDIARVKTCWSSESRRRRKKLKENKMKQIS